MTFRNLDPVTLTDASGRVQTGLLHLPDLVMSSAYGITLKPQTTRGGYGVHTITLPDGHLFRTEGRLARQA